MKQGRSNNHSVRSHSRPDITTLSRRLGLLGVIIFAMATAVAATPPTTWTVCSSGCNFTTIAEALASASVVNGDTIDVGPGTYSDALSITKEITLLGEQANVEPDAVSRVGNESIISNTYPIEVYADNVTINGFEFKNFETAINAVGDRHHLTFNYNRMVSSSSHYGISFGWMGHSATPPIVDYVTIAHNLIKDLQHTAIVMQGGDWDGTNGIDAKFAYIDISYNHIRNVDDVGLSVEASPDDYTIDHFTLKGNYLAENGVNCIVGNVLFGEMTGNLVQGSPCAVGMQAAVISGNSFVSGGDEAFLVLFGLDAQSGPSGPQFVRPTGNVVVTNNEFASNVRGNALAVFPDNPTTDNILVTTNAFRDAGFGTSSSSTNECFLEDYTGWIIMNYGNCGSDGTPDIRSQYLHADNNWWGGQDGTYDNSGSLYGKVTTDSWMSYYLDDPAKQVAPTTWPLSAEMSVNPGFWPINARYRAVFTETSDPRTIDIDDAQLGAPSLTVAGIGSGGAFFQFSATSQPSGWTPFKVTAGTVFVNVAVLSGSVVYPAQLCIYGEPGFELYHYVGGEWVKVSKTQVTNIICSTDLTELGIFTVAEPKDAPLVQYMGDYYVPSETTPFMLKAQMTGDSECISDKLVKFIYDVNGNGHWDAGEPVWGTATTDGSGYASTTYTASAGIYELIVFVEGDDLCLDAMNTATVVIAGTGDTSTGGGWYTNNGRINFGFTVTIRPSRAGNIVKGQMLWHVQGKFRFKGVVTAYTQTRCTVETATQTCGYVTGYGDLYTWNSDTEMWDLTATNIGYQATVFDGGSAGTGRKNGGTFKPDYFRMNFPLYTVTGESTSLIQLKGGNIVVK